MERTYKKPTVAQSIAAWRLMIDLIEDVGFPHNWQHEAPHIRSYMRDISEIVKRAYDIVDGRKTDD